MLVVLLLLEGEFVVVVAAAPAVVDKDRRSEPITLCVVVGLKPLELKHFLPLLCKAVLTEEKVMLIGMMYLFKYRVNEQSTCCRFYLQNICWWW